MIRLLFVGFGTVGQGLAELLIENHRDLKQKYGIEFAVVGITDKLKGSVFNKNGIDLPHALQMMRSKGSLSDLPGGIPEKEALKIIQTTDADVLLEATYTDIQTGEPAASHIRQALEKGMHVVTTNKGPLALHYHALKKLAEDKGVEFLFEGTVMSGTPLLNLIRETLAGSGIHKIQGILNGTTNYILTQMEAGMSYKDALKKAQELGYAEAVPDADVLGWDALAKVTILANVVFGAHKKPFDYPCEGITGITAEAVHEARKAGKRFKLIGCVWQENNEVQASVSPQQIELSHPLASVMNATNAVTISTQTLGDVTIVGPGAGRRETGFSMLIDLIHIARKP
ncbi:MAG: homoserine dehydrogenase [Candidatus Aminicenantales bacterium]